MQQQPSSRTVELLLWMVSILNDWDGWGGVSNLINCEQNTFCINPYTLYRFLSLIHTFSGK